MASARFHSRRPAPVGAAATQARISCLQRIFRALPGLIPPLALWATTAAFAATPPGSERAGVRIPEFGYQAITDAIPASNVCWWDPTNGRDDQDGSAKAHAKRTFAAAQDAIRSGGTIIVAGGRHTVPELVFTRSGTPASRLKLFAEPKAEVVLYLEGDFKGALERTWKWTLIDRERMIWESPDLGIKDGRTIVNNVEGRGAVTDSVAGFIRLPHGAHGRPHLMRLLWYDLDGNYVKNAFLAPNTGPRASQYIKDGGYGGPGFYLPGNGRVQVRMQKVTAAYSGNGWPTDGRFGTCVGPDGVWQEPRTEDPNDYEIHLTRFNGRKPLLNFNGQSWWHLKGINAALINEAVLLPDGSQHNLFERCTWYPQWVGVDLRGTTAGNRFVHCRILSADNRTLAWREHKTPNYWWQHARNVGFRTEQENADTAKDLRFEHCTFFGWFDIALGFQKTDTRVVIDHGAILNTIDDGFIQTNSDNSVAFDCSYTYFAGGPCWSGSGNKGAGTRDWVWHHCVYDNRLPMLWNCGAHADENGGLVAGNRAFPVHGAGKSGPVVIKKIVNCTFIESPDTRSRSSIAIGTGPENHNVPAGRAHEAFNNILVILDNRRFSGFVTDQPVSRLSCKQSDAGTHHYDYNCYWRDVPNPQSPLFRDIQDSSGVNRTNYASLAEFKQSRQFALSGSMYSDGTRGHEDHGVQEDPRFMDLARRDYRPRSKNTITGAKNVSAITGGKFENWKGAVDPNGDGSEVGPQDSVGPFNSPRSAMSERKSPLK